MLRHGYSARDWHGATSFLRTMTGTAGLVHVDGHTVRLQCQCPRASVMTVCCVSEVPAMSPRCKQVPGRCGSAKAPLMRWRYALQACPAS